MKSLIIIFILTISLSSCQTEINAIFEITNNTENTIDSINIKSFDHGLNPIYLKLKPNESQTYSLNMSDLPKVDGDYLLTYKTNKINSERFGYFTNGYPLEDRTEIKIQKDTIIIDQIFDKY